MCNLAEGGWNIVKITSKKRYIFIELYKNALTAFPLSQFHLIPIGNLSSTTKCFIVFVCDCNIINIVTFCGITKFRLNLLIVIRLYFYKRN